MFARRSGNLRNRPHPQLRYGTGPLPQMLTDERGTAAIEFAVILPVFTAGLVAIFVFGWAINGVMAVRHALDETSRELLLSPTLTQSEMQKKIDADVAYVGDSNVTVALTYDAPSGDFTIAHATASYPFTVSVPFLNDLSFEYKSSIAVPLKTD